MEYKSIFLKEEVTIKHLYTIHYFEYMNTFSFMGESHDFWEFVYVDKGAVEITSNDCIHRLEKGDIIFHQPNEFHNVTADGTIAPNLIVISFACESPHMSFFQNKILRLDEIERNLLASVIFEAKRSFAGRLDDPYQEEMFLNQPLPFGSLQLIKLYMEHFLIHLVRRHCEEDFSTGKLPFQTAKITKQKNNREIFTHVTQYLDSRLDTRLTIEQICRDNIIGRSQLQKIFHEQSGLGIIEYFSHMKIETAKHLMRTDQMNFTQIAEKLGYSSIHYFSRQFKKITGMTPSEYVSSVKALSEKRN